MMVLPEQERVDVEIMGENIAITQKDFNGVVDDDERYILVHPDNIEALCAALMVLRDEMRRGGDNG